MKCISTGLVSDSLLTLREIQYFSCRDIKALKAVHISHGVDIDNIFSFVKRCCWVASLDNDELALTDNGMEIVSLFNGYEIEQRLWRKILGTYIYFCKPVWASRIPFGREEACIFMSPDEKRCFFEAGLLGDQPSQNVIDWWDSISAEIRKENNLKLNEIGREGERLTFNYEKQRTGKVPKWKSFDTNLVGYDIISYVDQFSDRQLLLEVKTSSKPMDRASMTISRNEWEVATLTKSPSRYLIYAWNIGKVLLLAKLSVEDIAPHVPKSQGNGSWKEFEVPYDSFVEKFEIIKAVEY